MGIVSSMFLSCQKASFLISKKQETKLSFVEEIRLKAHLSMCTMCTNFKIQTDVLTQNLKKKGTELSSTKTPDLSSEKKEDLQQLIMNKLKEE